MLSMALLFAGHETTVAQIGMGALLLLTKPAQWNALRDNPGLIPNAVEEILRAPGKGGGGIPAMPAPTWRSTVSGSAPATSYCSTSAPPTTTRRSCSDTTRSLCGWRG
ncbi:hypothetical protein ACSHWB_45300 [Lentzea sp. HUAS TT2]|uniref:hypothetical protein n=1 Tax=Lentzea sp. HUAS TT2 TaxID=3447454 RepID=UPI003F6FB7BE